MHNYPYGYPSLAAFMASDVDRTALIFKRFDRLSARVLLCLGSELAELEAKLDEFDEQDRGLPCARNWERYKDSGKGHPEKAEILRRITDTMLEYKRMLAYESVLASQPIPDRRSLKAFRFNFFNGNPGDSNSFPTLGGQSSKMYDDANDLLILRPPEQEDRLSTFITNYLSYLFQEKTLEGASNDSRVGYASESRIRNFVVYLSILLAAILLIGAIVVLYLVRSPELKLGLVGVFTVLFAASVGILTNARRAEIFGSTAAYAAVLVVFVSGGLGGSP